MSTGFLRELPRHYANGRRAGIVSVCSAHPLVVEAALRQGLGGTRPVLIEATCNQVNQEGGYTGMTPADFRGFVETIAQTVGFPLERLILGGDHLGPNPWKHLPAEEALARARVMITDYARAGFTKLHLDASMGCRDEPVALCDELTAMRAADLAEAAERAVPEGSERPVYIIGTEVPVPGGALEGLDHVQVTDPQAVTKTLDVHADVFARRGLAEAFSRVIAIVVQPGVEFGNAEVVTYDRGKAAPLVGVLGGVPNLVFEAHSTDYQPEPALADLVSDGFAILKVGPWLTFALREALYGLDRIALHLRLIAPGETVAETMEDIMRAAPARWEKYYPGTPDEQRLQRHFSFSDRIRYYWPESKAAAAVERLLTVLGERDLPVPLISQYLAGLPAADFSYDGPRDARTLILQAIQRPLRLYNRAVAA